MCLTVREELRELSKDYDKSEDDLKALQSGVGQIVGEVLRQLTEEKCTTFSLVIKPSLSLYSLVIVKASNGPRYVVGCRRQVS